MKTRIISGLIMGIIVTAVLTLGYFWQPVIITVAIALLAAAAVYELICNAAGIKSRAAIIGASAFAALFVLLCDNKISSLLGCGNFALKGVVIFYFLFAVVLILKNNKDFDLGKIVSLFALPLPYAYAFNCLGEVIKQKDGIYYLLLMLNFACVCDIGAYFVGVTLGKHKLCPNLSPKKTVEGALGGITSSIIVSAIICICFGKSILLSLVLTIPFCILGMIGDLFASAIKRSVGLKDYSHLIPGHGGILDRVDSIIMIAPFLAFAINLGVI